MPLSKVLPDHPTVVVVVSVPIVPVPIVPVPIVPVPIVPVPIVPVPIVPVHGVSASAELAQSLRLSIARLARLLRQQDRTDHGATLTAALASVARHGGPTHGELAAIEQVAPPTITAVVGKMETLGLVTRETDPADRRVTRIRPTPAGLDLLADTRNRRTEWLQMQMNGLTASELAALAAAADVLGKLTIAPEADAVVAEVGP